MNAKPYPKYKPSGVEWLGDVPEGWEVKRLGSISRIQTGNTPSKTDEDNFTDEGMLWVKPDNLAEFKAIKRTKECLSESGRILSRTIPARSVLICCIGTIGKFGFADEEVATNQQINAITFKHSEIAEKFGLYVVSASEPEHIRRANTNVMAILNTANQSNISISVPPLPEQQAITDFLDERTGKLDGLLGKKRELIVKLKEKRSALISRTVTKGLPTEAAAQAGLTPNPKLKPSGIPWLGDIPEHWRLRRLKDCGKVVGGAGFPHDEQGREDGDLPFYKVGDLRASSNGLIMGRSPHSIDLETSKALRASLIPPGAVIYAKIGAALLLNRRRITSITCCIDNNMTAFVPVAKQITTKWAYYWLSILDFGEFVNPGAVPSYSEGDQKILPIPLPPISEQEAIIVYLDHGTAKIDRMIQKVETAIEKLTEYRTALITAAVTGKIDVRN